jgi:hypothetical protein
MAAGKIGVLCESHGTGHFARTFVKDYSFTIEYTRSPQ